MVVLLPLTCYKKVMKKKVALLYGRDDGHLDHIAPYCSLLQIPLYITEKILFDAAVASYPELTCIFLLENEVTSLIMESFDTLITTLPRQIINEIFFMELLDTRKKLVTNWLPHGSSDKKNMSALFMEDHLLIYGNKMLKMLPSEVRSTVTFIGNFRYEYYKKHKDFYNAFMKRTFPELFRGQNILYAPSWESDSIIPWVETLIQKKPDDVNLFIKLHPNTYQGPIGDVLMEKFNDYPQIYFIKDFFPIYPLISHICKLYTDISSIGYDFLTFNRPILFTSTEESPLHECGVEVSLENPYPETDINDHFLQREFLYKETFM